MDTYMILRKTSKIRACLGHVAPLGRPKSVYKSNIEYSFLSRNDGQMTLKVKFNYSHFQYQLRESQDAYLVIPAQIHYKKKKKKKSKWPKWCWRSRSMTSIFNTSGEYPRMHVWYKFGDYSPNLRRFVAHTSQISKNSESKWTKWPWSSRSMTSFFNTSRVFQDASLVQIWGF